MPRRPVVRRSVLDAPSRVSEGESNGDERGPSHLSHGPTGQASQARRSGCSDNPRASCPHVMCSSFFSSKCGFQDARQIFRDAASYNSDAPMGGWGHAVCGGDSPPLPSPPFPLDRWSTNADHAGSEEEKRAPKAPANSCWGGHNPLYHFFSALHVCPSQFSVLVSGEMYVWGVACPPHHHSPEGRGGPPLQSLSALAGEWAPRGQGSRHSTPTPTKLRLSAKSCRAGGRRGTGAAVRAARVCVCVSGAVGCVSVQQRPVGW